MRAIPVDVSRITFIGTGKAVARDEWVELSDGTRKRSGNQAKNDDGVPMWSVDVIVDDDDAMRAEAIGVSLASHDEPHTEKWKPVRFHNLTATIYTDRASGQAKVSLRAEGIDTGRKSAPAPAETG